MLNLGFIGCGSVSQTHLGRLTILEPGEARVAGLCDVKPENAQRLMRSANRCRGLTPDPLTDDAVYADYRRMLDALDLDAVIVCTPHTLHYEHVMAALERGLHVLVEKPMATSIRQAEEMRRGAEEKGRLLAIGYQRHFQPEYVYARERVLDGGMGRPHFVLAWLTQDLATAIGSRTWYLSPELSGGGQLICSGTHLTDIVLWVTGAEPVRVKAVMDREGRSVEMYVALTAQLSNGAVASISILGDAPDPAVREELRVWCSKGAVFVVDGKAYIQGENSDIVEVNRRNLPQMRSNPDANFVRAVLGKEECQVPASCGVNATRLEQMAYQDAGPIPSNLTRGA